MTKQADIQWVSLLPDVKSWLEIGDVVEGFLTKKAFTPGPSDQIRGEYTISTNAGVLLVFGTSKIDQGLADVALDSYVRITYKGEDRTRNGNTVKLFDVEIAPGVTLDRNSGEITGP